MLKQMKWLLVLPLGLGLVLLGVVLGAEWIKSEKAVSAKSVASTVVQTVADPFTGLADPSASYDQRFIDEMVMHHQGAIVSARMMIGGSVRAELRDLAARIEKGQQRQLDLMVTWRKQWYPNAAAPATGMDMMGGMMGNGSNQGMMGNSSNQGMMGKGGGQNSDRMFLRMMIPHHQLAIDMAKDALQNAERPEIKDLAREIIADQSAEITEMEGYLKTWYNETSTRDTAAGMRDMMKRIMGR